MNVFSKLMIFGLVLLLAACGTQDPADSGATSPADGTPPTGENIISAVELAVGSSSTKVTSTEPISVRAEVTNQTGAPMSGVVVEFTQTLTGTFSSTSATTNSLGIAEVQWRPGETVGIADISAHAGGFSDIKEIEVVPNIAFSVDLSVEREALTPNSSTAVTVAVKDSNGNPISGELVTLSRSGSAAGSLSAVTATTNANGEAVVTYTAGVSQGSDTITVRLGSNSAITTTQDIDVSSVNAQVGGLTLVAGNTSTVVESTTPIVVRATVTDTNGQPLPGVTVNFTGSLGTLSAATATTTSAGVAEVNWTPGSVVGTASINASTGGFNQVVQITISSAPAATIELSSGTSELTPNSSTAVTVAVKDSNGNPISGELVTLSRSGSAAGSLSAVTATTNANGEAVVTYTAGVSQGSDTITVRLGSNSAITTTQDIDVSSVNAQVGGLTLVAGNTSTVVESTTPIVVRATVTDTNGQPLPGVTVNFSNSLGTLSSPTGISNSSGVAEVTWTPGSVVGTASINASTGGFNQVVLITINPDLNSAVLTLGTTASSLYAGATATLTARLVDGGANPVAGRALNFSMVGDTSNGNLSNSTATTDVNGRAIVTYTAGVNLPVDINVVARVVLQENTTKFSSQGITLRANPLQNVSLAATRDSSTADGLATTLLTATLTDRSGQLVNGQECTFITTAGSLSALSGTTVNGVVATELTSTTNLGVATVTVACDSLTDRTTINFINGPATAVDLVLSPESVVAGGTVNLFAEVTDINGHAVPDEVVEFAVAQPNSGGLIENIAVVTDVNGRATTTYRSGSTGGTDNISATLVSGVTNNASLNVTSSALTNYPTSLVLTALSNEIVANGVSTARLRLELTDKDGGPVVGADIEVITNHGVLDNLIDPPDSSVIATTDSSGFADLELLSSTSLSNAVVQASYAGLNDVVTVNFIPGAISSGKSSISASPQTLLADGVSTTEVTVALNDESGHPVADGTPVTLNTTAGTISLPAGGLSNNTTTLNGRASFILTAPSAASTATLRVAGIPNLSGDVVFGSMPNNEPANISLSIASPEIAVAGVGQNDFTEITINVRDLAGNLIDESGYPNPVNNLRISFVNQPQGGEFLAGYDVDDAYVSGSSIDVTTVNGQAIIQVSAGTLPGILEVKAEFLRDADGNLLGTPLVAVSPRISIASGPPHAIGAVFGDSSLEEIPDVGSGIYRLTYNVSVADRYGNPVPDGTLLNLVLMDTAISSGTVQSTSGTTLTSTTSTFLTDSSLVNLTQRFIEPDDFVFIPTAIAADKIRNVVGETASTLTVNKAYVDDHNTKDYFVGAALKGSFVSGFVENVATAGTLETEGGIGTMFVTYPVDILLRSNHIGIRASDDTASLVKASVFAAQRPIDLTAFPDELSLSFFINSADVEITVSDGGNYLLNGAPVTHSISTTSALLDLTVTDGNTDADGNFTSTITVNAGASGDTATVTFRSLLGTADVTVTVP